MKLFLLSKEHLDLAKSEVEAIVGKGKLIENLFFSSKSTDRLAYTKLIGDVLITTTEKQLEKKVKNFKWSKIIKKSFAVDGTKHSKKVGGLIYDSLKNPKVNLKSPNTKILLIKSKNKIYVIKEIWKNEEDFNSRRSHKRPADQPISLDPKLARACINLTTSKKEIYDPFCGLGGFLIEAGLMNIFARGSDNNKWMIRECGKNLQHYGIQSYFLFERDATKIKEKHNYIVCDLPYGKNTKNISKDLYEEFFEVLSKKLKKRAVIMLPNWYKPKFKGLKVKQHFTIYVHKSLSKEIYVLQMP